VEADPHACAVAAARLEQADDPAVSLVEANVWDYQPAEPVDCATASMFCHHLSDAEILALLERVRGFGVECALINDLRRSAPAYAGCWLWTLCVPRAVQHDARLSIRRGFRATELQNLLDQPPHASATVAHAWLFRVAAAIRFHRGEAP